MIGDLIQQYGTDVLGTAFAVLLWLVGRTLSNHTFLKTMMERIVIEARAVVLEVEQTYVDGLAKGRADGELTSEEKAMARATALAALRANLGKKGLARLGRIVGLSDDAIDKLLGTHIEAQVKALAIVKDAAPAAPSVSVALSPPLPPLPSNR
jgi:hypothetical protein